MNIEQKAELQARIIKKEKTISNLTSEIYTRTISICSAADNLEKMIKSEEKDKGRMLSEIDNIVWAAAFLKEYGS